jgi:sugar transferase (PEP-CTERM system associated)
VSLQVLDTYEQLLAVVQRERIDKIIVALPERRGKLPVEALLACRMQGVEVEDGTSFYEHLSGKVMLENIRPSWLIFAAGFSGSPLQRLFKRLLDLVLSVLVTALSLPLLPWIALAIKLESRGPVLFSQERVGENGRHFVLYKFRSMQTDAEAATGPVFAGANDPRVTRVGKILRATRLDELPQLINVLRGEMSFVGPRPERPFFVQQYAKDIPYYTQRLSVEPGLTGWAQVNYPYGATREDAVEKLRLDLYYIKNMSLLLDLLILLKTVKIALLGRGSR